jgi:hypothetical protein
MVRVRHDGGKQKDLKASPADYRRERRQNRAKVEQEIIFYGS